MPNSRKCNEGHHPPLTAARLRTALRYNAETGEFHWLEPRSPRNRAGALAGSPNGGGYLRIMVDYVRYKAHRLAWLHVYGVWPSGVIDHINGNKDDNRIANLRDASISVNVQNVRRARSSNKSSGLLGVHWKDGKPTRPWGARISANGNHHNLGYFATPEEAHAAYVAAKRRLHDGCTI